MNDKKIKTGITSVTFRKKSCEEIISIARENGLDGIEWGGDIHVKPGDIANAKRVGELTRLAGLEVFSYGSYFRTDHDNFEPICQTAQALGCRVVRIWSKPVASCECNDEVFETEAQRLRKISDIAYKYDITVCMEFHNGTINDNGASSTKLIDLVGRDNIRTYWQPLYGFDDNIRDIMQLKKYIVNIHVYNWIYGKEGRPTIRKLLEENSSDWQKYVCSLSSNGRSHNFIIEFCKGDEEENFIKDAIFLNNLVDFN